MAACYRYRSRRSAWRVDRSQASEWKMREPLRDEATSTKIRTNPRLSRSVPPATPENSVTCTHSLESSEMSDTPTLQPLVSQSTSPPSSDLSTLRQRSLEQAQEQLSSSNNTLAKGRRNALDASSNPPNQSTLTAPPPLLSNNKQVPQLTKPRKYSLLSHSLVPTDRPSI